MGDRITQPNSFSRRGIVPVRAGQLALPQEMVRSLELHIDASQITGLGDGDKVASWDNLGRQGGSFVQATSTMQATFQTNELSRYPSVRFDGNDLMRIGVVGDYNFLHDGLGCTIIVVSKPREANPGNQQRVLSTANASTAEIGVIFNYNDFGVNEGLQYTTVHGVGGQANSLVIADMWPAQTWSIVAATMATRASDDFVAFSNGAQVGSMERDFDFSASDHSTVLALGGNDNQTSFFDGDIAEILGWNRVLSQANLRAVHAYLARKYVLPRDA